MLPKIAPSNLLGRRIFSAKEAKRAEKGGKIRYRRFMPSKRQTNEGAITLERCISADCLDIESDTEMTSLVRKVDRRGKAFQGWACVTKEQASDNNRSVEAMPTQDNPYHAHICFPSAILKVKRKLEESAKQLASHAHWRKKADKAEPTPD